MQVGIGRSMDPTRANASCAQTPHPATHQDRRKAGKYTPRTNTPPLPSPRPAKRQQIQSRAQTPRPPRAKTGKKPRKTLKKTTGSGMECAQYIHRKRRLRMEPPFSMEYEPFGPYSGHTHTKLRSPKPSSTLATGVKYLFSPTHSRGYAAWVREYAYGH